MQDDIGNAHLVIDLSHEDTPPVHFTQLENVEGETVERTKYDEPVEARVGVEVGKRIRIKSRLHVINVTNR